MSCLHQYHGLASLGRLYSIVVGFRLLQMLSPIIHDAYVFANELFVCSTNFSVQVVSGQVLLLKCPLDDGMSAEWINIFMYLLYLLAWYGCNFSLCNFSLFI